MEERKSYKDISDEVRQLAQRVDGVALSGAGLAGGKRRRRRSGSKKGSKKTKRTSAKRTSSKRRKSSRSKKSSKMQSFGSQLINLGLKMQNLQITGEGKKKGKRA